MFTREKKYREGVGKGYKSVGRLYIGLEIMYVKSFIFSSYIAEIRFAWVGLERIISDKLSITVFSCDRLTGFWLADATCRKEQN